MASIATLAGSGVGVGPEPLSEKVTPIEPFVAENVSGAISVRAKMLVLPVAHDASAIPFTVGCVGVTVDSKQAPPPSPDRAVNVLLTATPDEVKEVKIELRSPVIFTQNLVP
jgi:hypothetical protein